MTHDISHITCADFLRAPGVQTPLIARFSTVIHERGSPETIRDPRGFAVKFYTREGNQDIVGTLLCLQVVVPSVPSVLEYSRYVALFAKWLCHLCWSTHACQVTVHRTV